MSVSFLTEMSVAVAIVPTSLARRPQAVPADEKLARTEVTIPGENKTFELVDELLLNAFTDPEIMESTETDTL